MQEITKEIIEKLINAKEGPCISVYMPTKAAASVEVKMMPIQLKNLLSIVKKDLQEKHNMGIRNIDGLLKPAADLIEDRVFWQNQKEGLAIFISPEQFYYFKVNCDLPEKSTVSSYFNILPLIPELMFNNAYYVLALSRNKNRIFQCTMDSIVQLEIEGIPESLKDISKMEDSVKGLSFHSSGSASAGVVFHGVGGIDAEKKEELLQYFRLIDQGLNKYLDKKDKSPLIIMSVKDIFSDYLGINTYPYLLKDSLEGNPDECTPDLIHKNSQSIASDYFHEQFDSISSAYHDLKGTGKTSIQLENIVSAAYFSRVEQLFIKNNISRNGSFDPENNKVSFSDSDEENGQYDLYNFAAIKTISNGGQVFVLNEESIPDGEDIIAFYRF